MPSTSRLPGTSPLFNTSVPDTHKEDAQPLAGASSDSVLSMGRRVTRPQHQACQKRRSCHHLQKYKAVLGRELRRQIQRQVSALEQAVKDRTLVPWPSQQACSDTGWQPWDGCTLVREEGRRCVYMEFQRQGESRAEFASKRALQEFACDNRYILGVRSALPRPDGIYTVALDKMPESSDSFAHRVQVHDDEQGPYCLALRSCTAAAPADSDDTPG